MRFFCTVILLILSFSIYSQNPVYVEANIFSGTIAPHRVGMESLAKNPVMGAELNLYYQTTDKNSYNIFYNFPKTGFGLNYDNLGNPSVLGNTVAVYSFMDFKLKSYSLLSLNSRVAMGLAYVTKTFDKNFNPENVAVSTNVNFYLNWNFGLKYQPLDSKLLYNLSLGLIHYSNGAIIKPNKGLNQVVLSAGMAYNLSDINIEKAKNGISEISYKKHEFWGLATLNTADEYAYGNVGRGGGFYCSTVAIGYNRRYAASGKYGIALDVFYNENFYYYFDTNLDTLITIHENPEDIIRSGISIGHEFIYNKLSLISYAGIYYYKKVKPDEWFYTRIGLKYYPVKNIFINLSLKAYGFKAHYIESGIGFSLYK